MTFPLLEVNKVTSVMTREATPDAKRKHDIKAGVYNPYVGRGHGVQPLFARLPSKVSRMLRPMLKHLVGQVRSCSRHAGGVLVAENLDERMPLINSGGVRQAPWAEGTECSAPGTAGVYQVRFVRAVYACG